MNYLKRSNIKFSTLILTLYIAFLPISTALAGFITSSSIQSLVAVGFIMVSFIEILITRKIDFNKKLIPVYIYFVFMLSTGFWNRAFGGVMQCIELALCGTVAAYHASRIVNGTCLGIDGAGLAVLLAETAVLALVLVEPDTEQREPGEEAEDGAYGADGVAIGATIKEGQHAEDEHHNPSDD